MISVVLVNCQLDVQGERHGRLSLRKGEGWVRVYPGNRRSPTPHLRPLPFSKGERREKDTGGTVLKSTPIEILQSVLFKAEKSPIFSNLGSGLSFVLIPEPSINEQYR